MLSAQTGSWTWKILSTGNEKRKWYFLCLIEGLMIRGITSGHQIKPITCHLLKIQPLGCREPARMVGDKLSRMVTVKQVFHNMRTYCILHLGTIIGCWKVSLDNSDVFSGCSLFSPSFRLQYRVHVRPISEFFYWRRIYLDWWTFGMSTLL